MNKLTVFDQSFSGTTLNSIDLLFEAEEITLRELIIERVTSEVELYNKKESKPYLGLVIPDKLEESLNKRFEPKNSRIAIDPEQQVYIALDGFLKNQFFVFVNDIQIEDLEARLKVMEVENIHFVKLTALVGG